MDNIKLMGEQVLPKLRPIWDGQYEDKWWIKPLAQTQRAAPQPVREPAGVPGGGAA